MIIGIALIVLSWTLFKSLGLFLWASIVLTVVGSILAFFGLLFIVYFFNLDMKLTSFLESKFIKLYDKKKKNSNVINTNNIIEFFNCNTCWKYFAFFTNKCKKWKSFIY